jgi:hypothetical protein
MPHAPRAPKRLRLIVNPGRNQSTGEYAMAKVKKPKKSSENEETVKPTKGRKKTTTTAVKAARNKK